MILEGLPSGYFNLALYVHHVEGNMDQRLNLSLNDADHQQFPVYQNVVPSFETYYPEVQLLQIPIYAPMEIP